MMEGVEKQESNAEEVSALAWLWVIGPVVRGGGERWVTFCFASLVVLVVVVGSSPLVRYLLPLGSLPHLWSRRSPRPPRIHTGTHTMTDSSLRVACSKGLALVRRAAPVAAAVQGRMGAARARSTTPGVAHLLV